MYTFNSRVRYSETDENGRLTLTGVMNYLQDCSTFQSEDIGLGLEHLKRNNRAWWLTSWQIVIDRDPVLGEEIVIGTWPYDFRGIYGYRNFTICDRSGNYLVRANSVWFFFDTEKGRPVKVQESDIRGYGNGEERLKMEYAPRKIEVPGQCAQRPAVIIGKHHIDTNHHVNNSRYVEIAREALTEDFPVGELRVEYKKAAVLGDTVYPRVGNGDGGCTVALCGKEGEIFAIVWFGRQKHGEDAG